MHNFFNKIDDPMLVKILLGLAIASLVPLGNISGVILFLLLALIVKGVSMNEIDSNGNIIRFKDAIL